MSDEPAEDGPHMRRCSRCGKSFKSRKGTDMHIRDVHRGKGHRVTVIRADDGELSLADIAVDAELKRAMGEPLTDLEASLLP